MAYRSSENSVIDFVEFNYAEIESPGNFKDSINGDNFEQYYGKPAQRMLFINAYEMGQAYGGPEEGGWWVTTYEPLASIPITSVQQAYDAYDKLESWLAEQYESEREYTSAAGGADGTIMVESHFAKFQPDNPEAFRYE